MRTVKLVVIGNSGVGKTSLRGQYVSGRFSAGYRATIGADFIAKTVPHHSNSEESITLQIWDTAGQERFSSLSAAFFRGADAAVLMFDVNRPATLHDLTRWWSEFRAHAPLPDEDMADYCLVLVGNKTDLVRSSESAAVPEGTALRFIDELVPPSESRSSTPETPKDDLHCMAGHVPARVASGSDDENGLHESGNPGSDADGGAGPADSDIILVDETYAPAPDLMPGEVNVEADAEMCTAPVPTIVTPPRTPSIDLHALHHKRPSKSRSRSSPRFSPALNGTVSSTRTGFTSFHTPASSFSDLVGGDPYESAPSSPLARSRSTSPSPLPRAQRARRERSGSTLSTSTAPTITPARYATAHALERTVERRPPRGPKLFFTSAKTGAGVSDVFAYVAQRVVMRWEWEEAHEEEINPARNGSTVNLGDRAPRKTRRPACCSS